MRQLRFDGGLLQELRGVIAERTGLHPEATMRVIDKMAKGKFTSEAEMRTRILSWLYSADFLADLANGRGVLR